MRLGGEMPRWEGRWTWQPTGCALRRKVAVLLTKRRRRCWRSSVVLSLWTEKLWVAVDGAAASKAVAIFIWNFTKPPRHINNWSSLWHNQGCWPCHSEAKKLFHSKWNEGFLITRVPCCTCCSPDRLIFEKKQLAHFWKKTVGRSCVCPNPGSRAFHFFGPTWSWRVESHVEPLV